MFCKYLLISVIASTLLLSVSSATVAKEKKERPKKLSASINPERLKALKQSLEIKLFLKMTFPDACPVGIVEPIWEGDAITETYCRCPGGSYGFTCQENFVNPCSQNGAQYSSADSRVPSNYFIECNGPIPYLIKCAKGTVWNQRITVCDWDRSSLSVRKGPYQQQDNVLTYDEDYSHVLKPVHLDNPYSIQTIIQTDTYKQAAAQKDIYKSEFDNVIKQTVSNYGQQAAPVIQTQQPQQIQQRPVSNGYDSSKSYQSQPVAAANPNDYRFDLLLINQQNQPDLSQSPYQSNIVAEPPKPIQTQPILPQQSQQQSNYYNQQPAIVQTVQQQSNQYNQQAPALPIQQTQQQPSSSYYNQQQAPVVQNLPQQNHQFDMPDFYHQPTVNQQQQSQSGQYQQQSVQLPTDMNNIQQQTGAPISDNSNNYQQTVQQPIVQQPIVQQPVDNSYSYNQQPIVQQPIVQQPIVQQPVDNSYSYNQQPIVQQPIVQQPIVQQPIVQQPIVQQPIVQQPVDNSYSYNQQQSQNQPMPAVLPETQPQLPPVQSQPIQNAPAAYGQQSVPIQQVASPSYNQQAPPVQQTIDQAPNQPYYGQGPVVDPSQQQQQQQPQIQATLPEQQQQMQSNMIEQSFGNSQRVITGQFSDDSSSAGPMSGQVRSILETIQKPIIAATMSAIYDQIQRPNGGLRTSQSISGQPQQMILDTMIRPPQSSPLIILQQPNQAKNGIANVASSGSGPVTTGGVHQGSLVGMVAPSRSGQLVSSSIGANTGFGGPSSISNTNGVLGSGTSSFNPTVSNLPSIPPSTSVQHLPPRQLQQPALGRSVSLLRMLLPQVTPTTVNGDQQLLNVKIPFDKSEMNPDCANNLPNGLNLAMSVSFF